MYDHDQHELDRMEAWLRFIRESAAYAKASAVEAQHITDQVTQILEQSHQRIAYSDKLIERMAFDGSTEPDR